MDRRKYFERLLRSVLKKGLPPAVYVADERGQMPAGGHGISMSVPRLSLCLKGMAAFTIRRKGEGARLKLRPREVLYIRPRCGVTLDPTATYETLGVVFHMGFTRFLHYRQRARGGPRSSNRWPVYHAAGLLDRDGRFVCHSLNAEAPGDPRERYGRLKMELLLHNSLKALQQDVAPAQGKAHLAWEAACHYVQENCHLDLGRADVAAFLDLHPNHLSRLFKMFSDRTFNGYLRQARLSRSQGLLRDPRLTVDQVARRCGFSCANYFIRQYRNRYGVTPGAARGVKATNSPGRSVRR